MAIFFGIMSALTWGAGDFSCGLAAKRANVYSVVIGSQIVGVSLLIVCALIFNERYLTAQHLLWGGLAGIAGAIGLLALYQSLAQGRMGVAAPVSAVVSAALPVIAGALADGLPVWWQLVGFIIALIGVWFISRTDDSKIHLNELGLPLLAGAGFGFFLIFLHRAGDDLVFVPLIASRAASLVTTLIFASVTRQLFPPPPTQLGLMALGGAMDAAGNVFYALAAQAGRLDVAAVLSSLYPASTILLAWLILKEQFARWQKVGIVATLIAIVLIAL